MMGDPKYPLISKNGDMTIWSTFSSPQQRHYLHLNLQKNLSLSHAPGLLHLYIETLKEKMYLKYLNAL